jgi:hypothetical protein
LEGVGVAEQVHQRLGADPMYPDTLAHLSWIKPLLDHDRVALKRTLQVSVHPNIWLRGEVYAGFKTEGGG